MVKIVEKDISDIKNISLIPLEKITREILNQNNNLIVYFTKKFHLLYLQIFSNNQNRQILFSKMLCKNKNYLNSSELYGSKFNEDNFIMKIFFTLYIENPINIISSLQGINYLKQFIANFLCYANNKSIQIYLYRNMRNMSLETILEDIEFLKHRMILTSRLAIFIYKICTFNYSTSDKTIGLYFSKYYGRSRIVNNKSFGVTNVKGYIIKGINFTEEQLRYDIAIKLKQLDVDDHIVAQATGVQHWNIL